MKLHRGKLEDPFPTVMGHEIVGVMQEVADSLSRTDNVQCGDRVIPRGTCYGRWNACTASESRFCAENMGYGVRQLLISSRDSGADMLSIYFWR